MLSRTCRVVGTLLVLSVLLLGVPAAAAASQASLKPGSSGAAVVTMQRQLIAVGARPAGGADGIYGPATVKAVKVFQGWMGLPRTGIADSATSKALASAAATATGGRTVHLGVFPLPHTCAFWDTFGAPRSGGRHHEGTDIFAKKGTPIYAVVSGRITRQIKNFKGSLGGNQMWLTAPDGTYYFYAHLTAFAHGVGAGSPVHAGDVIGYVGSTGSASVTHLHFEVHPGGGPAVDPYRILKAAGHC